jgi:putative spermidine/putrescine transport system permease protein
MGGHRLAVPRWAVQIAPAAILVASLMAAPIAIIAILSFTTFRPGPPVPVEFTADNYVRWFADPYYREVLGRTIWLGLITSTLCLFIGYPLAYIFARLTFRGRALLMFIMMTPLFIGVVVRSLGWVMMLDRTGPIAVGLRSLGVPPEAVPQMLYTFPAVVISLVNVLLMFMVLPIYSSIRGIPTSLEEAGKTLGGSPVATWVRVTLPLSMPGVVAGWILVFVLSVGSFVQPRVIGGPSEHVMSTILYRDFSFALNWAAAAATGIVLLVVGLAAVILPRLVTRRLMKWDVEGEAMGG